MDIKGYRIERVIGRGGMATVYLAIQNTLERPVALKIMNPFFSQDTGQSKRFLDEGPIAARLNNAHIVKVYNTGVDHDHYYLAMEYLPGGTLKQRIREGLTLEQAVTIAEQVGSGLGYAHAHNVIHRDIKPQNILFRDNGEAVITDFGIAKASLVASQLTLPGSTFGSPPYMSPEQAKGQPLDARSDIYSLGVIFYEMLTGELPYQAEDSFAVAQMHISAEVPRLPPRLTAFQPLIDKLLAKQPEQRYATAEAFVHDLQALWEQWPGQSPPATTAADADITREQKPVAAARPAAGPTASANPIPVTTPAARSRKGSRVLVLVAVLVLVVGSAGYWYLQRRPTPNVAATAAKTTGSQTGSAPAAPTANSTPVPAAPAAPDHGSLASTEQSTTPAAEPASTTPERTGTGSTSEKPQPSAPATPPPAAPAKQPTATASQSPTTTVTKQPTATASQPPTTTITKQSLATASQSPTTVTANQPAATASQSPATSVTPPSTAAPGTTTASTTSVATPGTSTTLATAPRQTGTTPATAGETTVPVQNYLGEARALFQNKAFDASLEVIKQGLAEHPDDPALLALRQRVGIHQILARARQLLDQGQLEASLAAVDAGLKRNPDSPDLLLMRAEIQLQQVTAHQPSATRPAPPATTAASAQNPAKNGSAAAQPDQTTAPAQPSQTTAPAQPSQTTAPAQQPKQPDPTAATAAGAAKPVPANSAYPTTPANGTQIANAQSPTPAATDAHQHIAELLAAAVNHINNLQLTTPSGNNAYEDYQAVLTLDPHNADAEHGLDTIAKRYLEWARHNLQRGDYEQSLSNIAKGLHVRPDQPELLDLRRQALAQQAAAQAKTAKTVQPAAQPAQDPCKVDRGSKACWCQTFGLFCQ